MTMTIRLTDEEKEQAQLDYIECALNINLNDYRVESHHVTIGEVTLTDVLKIKEETDEEKRT